MGGMEKSTPGTKHGILEWNPPPENTTLCVCGGIIPGILYQVQYIPVVVHASYTIKYEQSTTYKQESFSSIQQYYQKFFFRKKP